MNPPQPVDITKEELHARIWKQPLKTVASKLYIPVEDLRKLCLALRITIPPADYWTNPSVRSKIPVPAITGSIPDNKFYTIHPKGVIKEGKFIVMGEQEIREDLVKNEIGDAPVAKRNLSNPDPLVVAAKERYLKGISWCSIRDRRFDALAISVPKASLERALKIMQSIIEVLRLRGHDVAIINSVSCALIYGQKIEFYLREIGKVDKTKKPEKSSESRTIIYTGRFQLLTNWHFRDVCCTDGTIPMEQQLIKIVAYLELKAIGRNKAETELKKLDQIIAQQKQEQIQIKQQRKEVVNRVKDLSREASQYATACKIRDYIRAAIDNKGGDKFAPQCAGFETIFSAFEIFVFLSLKFWIRFYFTFDSV